MTTQPDPVRIYRIIHVDNLEVCLKRGGLHAPNALPGDGLIYRTIHNIEIQNYRRITSIPCGPRGNIHDYVSFYFGTRSPMLYQLCTGQVAGYAEKQDPLIYLISTAQLVSQSNIPFVFSDGHGIAAFTEWYDNLVELKNVDWEAVFAHYWFDTTEDPDRQRRKQAEFLIFQFCPWEMIFEIGVLNDTMKTKVTSILQAYNKSTPVQIHKDWYY
jgi:hypothetical protein